MRRREWRAFASVGEWVRVMCWRAWARVFVPPQTGRWRVVFEDLRDLIKWVAPGLRVVLFCKACLP